MNGQQPPPMTPPPPPKKLPEELSPSTGQGVTGKPRYPNPPDIVNPDAATLREQWRFAIRQYSKWYSHAWGTAILAGLSFFALGWVIKGSNPLPSRHEDAEARIHLQNQDSSPSS